MTSTLLRRRARSIEEAIIAYTWVITDGSRSPGEMPNTDPIEPCGDEPTSNMERMIVYRLTPLPGEIKNEYDVKAFIVHVIVGCGLDTRYELGRRFGEYGSGSDGLGTQMFGYEEARVLDMTYDECVSMVGLERYAELVTQLVHETHLAR